MTIRSLELLTYLVHCYLIIDMQYCNRMNAKLILAVIIYCESYLGVFQVQLAQALYS